MVRNKLALSLVAVAVLSSQTAVGNVCVDSFSKEKKQASTELEPVDRLRSNVPAIKATNEIQLLETKFPQKAEAFEAINRVLSTVLTQRKPPGIVVDVLLARTRQNINLIANRMRELDGQVGQTAGHATDPARAQAAKLSDNLTKILEDSRTTQGFFQKAWDGFTHGKQKTLNEAERGLENLHEIEKSLTEENAAIEKLYEEVSIHSDSVRTEIAYLEILSAGLVEAAQKNKHQPGTKDLLEGIVPEVVEAVQALQLHDVLAAGTLSNLNRNRQNNVEILKLIKKIENEQLPTVINANPHLATKLKLQQKLLDKAGQPSLLTSKLDLEACLGTAICNFKTVLVEERGNWFEAKVRAANPDGTVVVQITGETQLRTYPRKQMTAIVPEATINEIKVGSTVIATAGNHAVAGYVRGITHDGFIIEPFDSVPNSNMRTFEFATVAKASFARPAIAVGQRSSINGHYGVVKKFNPQNNTYFFQYDAGGNNWYYLNAFNR